MGCKWCGKVRSSGGLIADEGYFCSRKHLRSFHIAGHPRMVALVKMVQRGVHPRTYKEEVEENIKAKPWREQAQYWMSQGLNNVEVAKKVGVHRITVQRFAKQLRDKKWRDGHIRYLNLTEGRQRAAKKKAEECRAIRTAAQRFEDERKKK